MELREIIRIFEKEKKIFFGIFSTLLLFGLLFFLFQPERLVANLMLNVTRKGVEQTQDYRYDFFYRLQADERFADTVVRWTASPSVRNEISEKSGYSSENNIKAKRLSSQMIEIVFTVESRPEAEKTARFISEVLNDQTENLNKAQNEEAWFMLVANPVEVQDGRIGADRIFLGAILLGLFLGVLGAMLKHYLKD